MSAKRLNVAAAFTLLLTFVPGLAPALRAQAVSTATVTGRATDEQGALVTGAQIKLTGVDTGAISTAVTNQDGIYTLPNLPIGAYTLQTSFPGFQTHVQTGIVLRVNDHVQINVIMKVGAVTETVEVNANAGLVQTQQNTISQVVDQQRIVDLPLNGRDPTQQAFPPSPSGSRAAAKETGLAGATARSFCRSLGTRGRRCSY